MLLCSVGFGGGKKKNLWRQVVKTLQWMSVTSCPFLPACGIGTIYKVKAEDSPQGFVWGPGSVDVLAECCSKCPPEPFLL